MRENRIAGAAKRAACLTKFFLIDKSKVLPFLWPQPALSTGEGAALKAPQILRELGVGKVMVVTGPRSGAALAAPVLEALRENGVGYEHFQEVESNPSVETAERIYRRYAAAGCQGFLAIGGGSAIDAAKAAAARVARPGTPLVKLAGLMRLRVPAPPIVAIPTTAGTGSECTYVSVITDRERGIKIVITDQHLMPRAAILDPLMTRGMPRPLTAATGMDALTHAVEAYLSVFYRTAFSIRNAEEAAAGCFRYLERAFADGGDLEARAGMLRASYQAGLAFTRAGVGNVHAIAHALGGRYGVAHGLANAVLLPVVLEDYGETVYPRLARLAELCGVKRDGTQEARAWAFIGEIRAMNARMGIPSGLDCIRPEDLDRLARTAVSEANRTYPTPVIYDPTRCRRVLERVAQG